MESRTPSRWAKLMLGSLPLWLQGCAIGTPWPDLAPVSDENGNEQVVLVLTRVVVDTSDRREFDRQNRRVLASMGSQPGLIGYAARRQLIGGQGWTMSVWADDEARAAFVRSPVHLEAIAKSLSALRVVELKRLKLARKNLPANWDEALLMLADPEGLRNYLD